MSTPEAAADVAALPPGHQYVMVRCAKCPDEKGKANGKPCRACKGVGYTQGVALLPKAAEVVAPEPPPAPPEARPIPPIEVDGHAGAFDAPAIPEQVQQLPTRDEYMAADDDRRRQLLYLAGVLLRAVKGWRKYIDGKHRPGINEAHKEHKKRTGAFNTEDAEPARLENYLAARVDLYMSAERVITDRRQAELDRQLAEEQKKLQADEAEALRELGQPEAAEAVAAAPPPAPPIVRLPPAAKAPAGISQRMYWEAEVFDVQALCLAVAEGQVPPEAVIPNMTFLNSRARDLKTAMSIPGVVAKPRSGVSTRV